MSCINYSCTPTTFPTSPSCWHYNIIDRPKPKHHIFRPSRRGRPNSLSTPFLIFWSPRSIYLNSPRIWNNFTYCNILRRKKRTFRLHRHSLSYNSHRPPRLYCLSPPYIHGRNRRRYPSILYIRNNNYCNSNRR